MGEIEEPPIPESYLQRDGLPIVVCQCGKKWCLDSTGERSHIAYAKHWREIHGAQISGVVT